MWAAAALAALICFVTDHASVAAESARTTVLRAESSMVGHPEFIGVSDDAPPVKVQIILLYGKREARRYGSVQFSWLGNGSVLSRKEYGRCYIVTFRRNRVWKSSFYFRHVESTSRYDSEIMGRRLANRSHYQGPGCVAPTGEAANWPTKCVHMGAQLPVFGVLRGSELLRGGTQCRISAMALLGRDGLSAAVGVGREIGEAMGFEDGALSLITTGPHFRQLPAHLDALGDGDYDRDGRRPSHDASPKNESAGQPRYFDIRLIWGCGAAAAGAASIWYSSGVYIYWRRRRLAVAVAYAALGVGITLLGCGAYMLERIF